MPRELPTSTFTVPRTILMRFGMLEYLRNFWWFAAIIPLFGLACVIFTTGLIQGIGLFAVLWPFSIPARAVLASSKSARFFGQGVTAFEEYGVLYFSAPDGKGMKLALDRVREAKIIGSYLRLRMGIGEFVLIPLGAIPNQDPSQFGVPLTPDGS